MYKTLFANPVTYEAYKLYSEFYLYSPGYCDSAVA